MPKKKSAGAVIGNYYDEAKWRAEEDMRTLARAQEIKADPQRLKAARSAPKEARGDAGRGRSHGSKHVTNGWNRIPLSPPEQDHHEDRHHHWHHDG